MNRKTVQALDTLAEEYGVFEVTMKKVTFEHKEKDVLHAVASEMAEDEMSSNLPAKASSLHLKSSRTPELCATQHAKT